MHRLIVGILIMTVLATVAPGFAAGQDADALKHTAALSDFGAKIESLDEIADDIALSGALALLVKAYPDGPFVDGSEFEQDGLGINNDIGAVAGKAEYGMTKIRGALIRNDAVTEEKRALAIAVFEDVKALIADSYAFVHRIEAGDGDGAAAIYHDQMLPRADAIDRAVRSLAIEIDRAVKFAAL